MKREKDEGEPELQIKQEAVAAPPKKKYKTERVGGVLTVDLTEDD